MFQEDINLECCTCMDNSHVDETEFFMFRTIEGRCAGKVGREGGVSFGIERASPTALLTMV